MSAFVDPSLDLFLGRVDFQLFGDLAKLCQCLAATLNRLRIVSINGTNQFCNWFAVARDYDLLAAFNGVDQTRQVSFSLENSQRFHIFILN